VSGTNYMMSLPISSRLPVNGSTSSGLLDCTGESSSSQL
jgi:aspartate aminotransferase